MNRFVTSKHALPGSTVLGTFVRSLVDLAKTFQHRREVMNLAELDDRMLKDIGLTRSDVDAALAEPILHNPSWVLVRSAARHSRAEKPKEPAVRQIRPVVPLVTPDKQCA